MKVAALSSGGKDSCLASYEAISEGYEISTFINYVYKDARGESPSKVSNFLSSVFRWVDGRSPNVVSNLLSVVYKDLSRMVPHEVAPEIIAMQAQAIEIPIVQMEVRWDTFEHQFKTTLRKLKRTDAEGGRLRPSFSVVANDPWYLT